MRATRYLLAVLAVVGAASCGDDADDSAEAAFRIENSVAGRPGEPTSFTATGDAVDDGMLCADGEWAWLQTLHADTGLPESPERPLREGEILWVEFRFTCADGTGDFVLRADATVDNAELESVLQTGEMSSHHPLSIIEGTGNYDQLQVEGSRQWSVTTPGGPDFGVYDVFSGTMTRG